MKMFCRPLGFTLKLLFVKCKGGAGTSGPRFRSEVSLLC